MVVTVTVVVEIVLGAAAETELSTNDDESAIAVYAAPYCAVQASTQQ